MGVIYCIRNMKNDKKYIGQTTKNIDNRIRQHFYNLDSGKHKNKHLQNAWIKYGKESFEYFLLKTCSKEELDYYEKYYISEYNTTNTNFGYNKESGGNLKKEISEETRKKMSVSAKNRIVDDLVDRIKYFWLGKKHTDETKAKISKGNKGKTFDDETRKKMSESAKRKPPATESFKNLKKEQTGGEGNPRFGKKLNRSSSSYFGVYFSNGRFFAQAINNKKYYHLVSGKNEILCAMYYDVFIIRNNLNNPLNFPEKIDFYKDIIKNGETTYGTKTCDG